MYYDTKECKRKFVPDLVTGTGLVHCIKFFSAWKEK